MNPNNVAAGRNLSFKNFCKIATGISYKASAKRSRLFTALLSVVERGWPNALDSLDLEFNIPRMYHLMSNSFMECFVHYLMKSNCTCVHSTALDNFALDQTSLDKKWSSRLHSTRWPNALDISLNMHVERCIVKSRERLARA